MEHLAAHIGEVCFKLLRAQSIPPIKEALREAAGLFGVSFFLFGMRSGKNIAPVAQVVISNYPKRWTRRYDEMGAWAFDPVFNTAIQFKGPFRWDGLHKSAAQLALRAESVANGMNFGFTTSDRGPDASVAILSFCGAKRVSETEAEWAVTAHALSMLATFAHKAVAKILENRAKPSDPIPELRPIELQAISQIAQGRTAEHAAAVLKVKTRTVRYYLDRAAQKFGVATRREAVTKAIALGLVDIRQMPELSFGGDTETHD